MTDYNYTAFNACAKYCIQHMSNRYYATALNCHSILYRRCLLKRTREQAKLRIVLQGFLTVITCNPNGNVTTGIIRYYISR